jgi:[protein-PII] uridylyltransferase
MDLANRHQRRISHPTWQAIREAMKGREVGSPDAATSRQFIELLNRPGKLADLLRRLHELRVLEQIIPAMRHARCLLQFNEYHKYTVDAHSIRAVEAATSLVDSDSLAGELYRDLKNPWLLHLSLLIHDLGKGYEREHCEIGKEIAEETGKLLNLEPADAEVLSTLVFHHLLMIHTALRHDLTDPAIIEGFAKTLGSSEVLDLMLIHSVCDLVAVGPDVLTDWKEKLLYELYHRARRFLLEGGSTDRTDQRVSRIRNTIRGQLIEQTAGENALAILMELPLGILDGADVNELTRYIRLAAEITAEDRVRCQGRFLPDQDATEYVVIFQQGERPIGLFMLITGALLSQGLEILRSQIETLESGLAWDHFVVRDPDYQGTPPAWRVNEVCKAIENALLTPAVNQPRFRRMWKGHADANVASLRVLPCRVEFDNATSERFTVLSIFAYDRPGLLYALARVIAEAELVIHFAKIDTHLDQAADVFYVCELDGRKIEDQQRQGELSHKLICAAEDNISGP